MTTNSTFSTPILFLIFNRPDTTKIVFEEIRKIKPTRLFIAADGPRANKAGEDVLCAEARAVSKLVDWPCDVTLLYRDKNLGCGTAVSEAITWFFDQVEEGIILEDDCLPDPSFFHYCSELLARFRDDKRIMHIGANNFNRPRVNGGNYSYYFSRYGYIWGWATWRRAWRMYDFRLQTYPELKNNHAFDSFFSGRLEKAYQLKRFESIYKRTVDTWDFQWDFARLTQSGLSIVPSRNLVTNIGFREDATHTKKFDKHANVEMNTMSFPMAHPPYVVRDVKMDEEYFSFVLKNIIGNKLKIKL